MHGNDYPGYLPPLDKMTIMQKYGKTWHIPLVQLVYIFVACWICKRARSEPPHGKTNILHMRKQKRRSASQKLISAFDFATRIVQLVYFLDLTFPASSYLLRLYTPPCVRPGRKPYCWFSHKAVKCQIMSETTSKNGIADSQCL